MTTFEIAGLWLYPVKSLGGMAVDRAIITPAGSLAGDREWIVTRPDGQMLWQGDVPAMTLLSARLDDGELVLAGPGPGDSIVARPEADSPATVFQYGYSLKGLDQGQAVAQWLSDRLSTPCRLVRVGAAAHGWAGLNPLHAVSLVSLSALNARLRAQHQAEVEAERFRPNIVLAGQHDPFAEERTEVMDFSPARLLLREPCTRCELPNISRVDASRGKQPLKLVGTMSTERASARPAAFGIYSRAEGEHLSVGSVAKA